MKGVSGKRERVDVLLEHLIPGMARDLAGISVVFIPLGMNSFKHSRSPLRLLLSRSRFW